MLLSSPSAWRRAEVAAGGCGCDVKSPAAGGSVRWACVRPVQRRRNSSRGAGAGGTTRCSSSSSEEAEESTGVVVVGAGLAGLAAARTLARADVPVVLLEASDGVGGRVRTDVVRGFRLDRGFQLLLSGYPETRAVLDYEALELRPFYAGALVRADGGFHRVADPVKHPADGLASLFNPVGSPLDKLRVGALRLKATLQSVDAILSAPETSALDRLRAEGFSPAMIQRFFQPFFGGVFFDPDLATSSRLLEFVFRAFATGANAVPAAGMGAIPAQLAAGLPSGAIRLASPVESLLDNAGVKVRDSGTVIRANHGVVVAVPGPEAARLLGPDALGPDSALARPPRRSLTVYFDAPRAPHPEPVLFLNGAGRGWVNSLVVMSNVAPEYAPPGRSLVSVSVIPRGGGGEEAEERVEDKVREELGEWFGDAEVAAWEHLRTYDIPYGQPDQTPPTDLARPVRVGPGVYVCGDHRDHATTHGALVSGRRAAEALLEDVRARARARS